MEIGVDDSGIIGVSRGSLPQAGMIAPLDTNIVMLGAGTYLSLVDFGVGGQGQPEENESQERRSAAPANCTLHL